MYQGSLGRWTFQEKQRVPFLGPSASHKVIGIKTSFLMKGEKRDQDMGRNMGERWRKATAKE